MEVLHADGYIQIASVFFSTFLAVYTYKLARFFRDGIFYRSYKLMWPAWVFYAFGSFVDVFPELNVGPQWIHTIHALSYGIFFILISLSIYRFYNGWKEIGLKQV